MDIAIGIAVALLVAIIGLRLGKRRAEARLPPELVQALHLDKTSKGAQAYLALAGEMLRREEAAGAPAFTSAIGVADG